MSSLVYGAISRKRDQAPVEESTTTEPPGLKTYVDALAGLVPAEVLAAHAVVISNATETEAGSTTITAQPQLALFFAFFFIASAVLYIVGRGGVKTSLDWARMAIPPFSFVGWTMLQPTTVFDGFAPNFDADWRWAIGLVLALVLGTAAAWLGVKADKNPPVPA